MPDETTSQPAHSSLEARLNVRLLLRLAGLYLCVDLLLPILLLLGTLSWAEGRFSTMAELVAERGLPDDGAAVWLEAGGCSITPLDRDAQGWSWSALPLPENTREGRRSASLRGSFLLWHGEAGRAEYTVELSGGGSPYAITLDLSGPVAAGASALQLLILFQVLSLAASLFQNARSIRKVLSPIQDLASAARSLGAASSMGPEELRKLAVRLGEIDNAHLDARIPVEGAQRELKDLAEAINAMLDRIDQSYRNQTRFVSDASHELRTPIAVIQGYANLLDRWGKDDPATMQESINAISQEARSMKELVEQLLFLARGDSDSLPVEPEVFDLTAVAAQVVRDSQIIDHDHPMETSWTGPVYVNCDLGLIRQAVRVLMDNAIKYTPAGGKIALAVEAREGTARLSVTDEGPGIPPEALPHVFDRFFRADESRTRGTGGSGLGLSIAKWIVERHSGWIEVVSRPSAGTKMTLVLPALDDPPEPPHS